MASSSSSEPSVCALVEVAALWGPRLPSHQSSELPGPVRDSSVICFSAHPDSAEGVQGKG